MSSSYLILTLLKQSTHSTKLLNQILAQTTTTGLLQATTLIWNCIIRAYAKSPNPIQAILIYNHFMQNRALYPDKHTYPALLKAFTCLPSLPKAKEIHAHVIKIGLACDVFIQNSLIHIYGFLSQSFDATNVFEEMPHKDTASWNSIITAYILESGLRVKAFSCFGEMVCGNVQVDEITLAILLSACEQGEMDHARIIHAYFLKHGFVLSTKLGNATMACYVRVGNMDAAIQVFEEMGLRDMATFTILINGYIELGLVDLAHAIFNRMCSRDLFVWNSMINGYTKAKRPKEALVLFKQMEVEMVHPDEITMVGVLSACTSLNDLQCGRLVHRMIRRKGIIEDVFMGTALVDMYGKCGSLEDATLTFYKMNYKDVFAWTALISGFATHGRGTEALELFSQMQQKGLEPNAATFVAVLKACSHSGLIDEGQLWFKRMVESYQIQPKIEHVGCMIDLLSRVGSLCEAEELIRTITVEDKIIAYKTLLAACISYGDVGIGEKVAEELIRLETHTQSVYVLLSNFYAFVGRWDVVEKMRMTARRMAMMKEPGMSFCNAKNLHESLEKRQCHSLQCTMPGI